MLTLQPCVNETLNTPRIIMNTIRQRYRISDSIVSILGVGARCRTCGRIYDVRELAVAFCSEHDSNNTSEEASLGRLACQMQDYFYGIVAQRLQGFMLAHLYNSTPSEQWWWLTMNTFRLQCEISLIDLYNWWISIQGTQAARK